MCWIIIEPSLACGNTTFEGSWTSLRLKLVIWGFFIYHNVESKYVYGSKFFFPGIFFFRHPSKSCSVFYILEPKFFFRKDQKKHFRIFFLNLHVPGYTKIQKNNFKNIFFDLSEKKFLVPICKKLNNFCFDDRKNLFLDKKNLLP